MSNVTCPSCQGRRTSPGFVERASGGYYDPAIPCLLCKGTGEVPEHVIGWLAIGEAHRKARVAREESIMECARRIGVTAAELSGMEHGRRDPARLEIHNG